MLLYDRSASNRRSSWILIIAFVIIIIALGSVIGTLTGYGSIITVFAFIFAIMMAFVGYYWSADIALKISRAVPADPVKYRHLHNVVEGISIAAGIPKPQVYIVEDPALNAFATGRDPEHSAVAVTRGLLEKMNDSELEGVLAHEMSHVKNRDIQFMTLVVVLVGVITLISDIFLRSFFWGRGSNERGNAGLILLAIGIVLAVLAPLFATLIRLAISRKREYLADVDGVLLTRYPQGLINALQKLKADERPVASATGATAHLWIDNPLKNTFYSNLFSTHPPIDDRIKALQNLRP
ncbi:MAG: M48 family metallopeptidase [Candidatus Diapherotrites archaeon]